MALSLSTVGSRIFKIYKDHVFDHLTVTSITAGDITLKCPGGGETTIDCHGLHVTCPDSASGVLITCSGITFSDGTSVVTASGFIGATGATGPQGATGLTGATGPQPASTLAMVNFNTGEFVGPLALPGTGTITLNYDINGAPNGGTDAIIVGTGESYKHSVMIDSGEQFITLDATTPLLSYEFPLNGTLVLVRGRIYLNSTSWTPSLGAIPGTFVPINIRVALMENSPPGGLTYNVVGLVDVGGSSVVPPLPLPQPWTVAPILNFTFALFSPAVPAGASVILVVTYDSQVPEIQTATFTGRLEASLAYSLTL